MLYILSDVYAYLVCSTDHLLPDQTLLPANKLPENICGAVSLLVNWQLY